MFYLATNNWTRQTKQKCMSTDLIKLMDRMLKFHSTKLSESGWFPPRMFRSSWKMPLIWNCTKEKDTNLHFWLPMPGSKLLQILINNKFRTLSLTWPVKLWLDNIAETPTTSIWSSMQISPFIFMPSWRPTASTPASLQTEHSTSLKNTESQLSKITKKVM